MCHAISLLICTTKMAAICEMKELAQAPALILIRQEHLHGFNQQLARRFSNHSLNLSLNYEAQSPGHIDSRQHSFTGHDNRGNHSFTGATENNSNGDDSHGTASGSSNCSYASWTGGHSLDNSGREGSTSSRRQSALNFSPPSNSWSPSTEELFSEQMLKDVSSSFSPSMLMAALPPLLGSPDYLLWPTANSFPLAMEEEVAALFRGLMVTTSRPRCITELCKRSDVIPGLGCLLWYSPSVMPLLLLELLQLYPLLHPPQLTHEHLQYVSSILALLQQVVLDRRVKDDFLNSRCQFYVVPFLMIEGKSRDTEHLRVCLLSFFATIVQKAGKKVEELEEHLDLLHSDVLRFTITAVDCCCTDVGKSLAMLILSRILRSTNLLNFIAESRDRFHDLVLAVGHLVQNIVRNLPLVAAACLHFRNAGGGNIPPHQQHQRNVIAHSRYEKLVQVLVYAVHAFVCLCENSLLRDALRLCLPSELMDRNLCKLYPSEPLKFALQELWQKVETPISNVSNGEGSAAGDQQ